MCEVVVVCELDIYQEANRRRPLILTSIDFSKTWRRSDLRPMESSHGPKNGCGCVRFFPETVRYTFVPKDSLVEFVSIVGTGSTSLPTTIYPPSRPPTSLFPSLFLLLPLSHLSANVHFIQYTSTFAGSSWVPVLRRSYCNKFMLTFRCV